MKILKKLNCPQLNFNWRLKVRKQDKKWHWTWRRCFQYKIDELIFNPHLFTYPEIRNNFLLGVGLASLSIALSISFCAQNNKIQAIEAENSDTNSQLVLNEIYPSPAVGEKEWLEIYNVSNETVKIEGWKVAELISGQIKNHEQVFDIDASQNEIPAHGFLLMENSKISLNNTGDTIYLFNPEGQMVDLTTYGTIKEKSWGRIADGGTWQILDLKTPRASNAANFKEEEISNLNFIDSGPLKTTVTEAQNYTETTKNITLQISEIMACPNVNETEWVEVMNSGGDWKINSWKIKNSKGSSRTIKELNVKDNALNIIEFSSGLLSNSGDRLIIEDENGREIVSAEYPACINKGTSFVFDGENWLETQKTTKGEKNVLILNIENQNTNQLEIKTEVITTTKGEINDENLEKTDVTKSENNPNLNNNEAQKKISFDWSQVKFNLTAEELRELEKNGFLDRISTIGGTLNNKVDSPDTHTYDLTNNPKPNKWLYIPGLIIGIATMMVGSLGLLYLNVKDKLFPENKKILKTNDRLEPNSELAFADLV